MNQLESAPRTYADSHVAIVTIRPQISTAAWTSRPTRARLGSRRRGRDDDCPGNEDRVRCRARRADSVYAAHARLLPGARLQPLPLGALRRRAVHALADAARPGPGGAHHDGGAVPARARRPGPGRALQRRREILQGVLAAVRERARSPDLARRLRPRARSEERRVGKECRSRGW